MAEKIKTSSNPKHIPKDAQVIVSIMKDMGITDYEPRVINQLLEFSYRYVTCILDDSKIYATHSKKKFIDIDDVRLAVKMQTEKSFTNPPPREVLLDVAKTKNNIPLPPVKPSYGLRLPPDRYCLNGTNYKLKSLYRKSGKLSNASASGGLGRINHSLVKRPGLMSSVSRTQNISLAKPMTKVIHSTASAMNAQQQMKPKIPTASDAGQINQLIEIKPDPEDSNKRKREDDDYDVP